MDATQAAAADLAQPDDTTELGLLLKEVYDCMEHVRQYRAGNTELIEALMLMAEGGATAAENAQRVLAECGMVNGADGTLNWPALRERKDGRWTLRQCVQMLIKNPETAAKLLLLDEEEKAPPFGGPELLHLARTLCAGIERLPASSHVTELSARAAQVAHGMQQLQATGDYFWPRPA